jgi:hypothetical protein
VPSTTQSPTFHRSLGQEDQARDEVLHDGLQAEADATDSALAIHAMRLTLRPSAESASVITTMPPT